MKTLLYLTHKYQSHIYYLVTSLSLIILVWLFFHPLSNRDYHTLVVSRAGNPPSPLDKNSITASLHRIKNNLDIDQAETYRNHKPLLYKILRQETGNQRALYALGHILFRELLLNNIKESNEVYFTFAETLQDFPFTQSLGKALYILAKQRLSKQIITEQSINNDQTLALIIEGFQYLSQAKNIENRDAYLSLRDRIKGELQINLAHSHHLDLQIIQYQILRKHHELYAALEVLKACLEINPFHIFSNYALAHLYFETLDFDKTETYLQTILSHDPFHQEALFLSTLVAIEHSDWKEVKAIETIIKNTGERFLNSEYQERFKAVFLYRDVYLKSPSVDQARYLFLNLSQDSFVKNIAASIGLLKNTTFISSSEHPESHHYIFDLARLVIGFHTTPTSYGELNQMIRQTPSLMAPYVFSTYYAIQKKDENDARDFINKAIYNADSTYETYYSLSFTERLLLKTLKDQYKNILLHIKPLRNRIALTDLFIALIHINLSLDSSKHIQLALSRVRNINSNLNSNYKLFYVTALVHYLNEDDAKALQAIKQARHLNPNGFNVILLNAHILIALKQYKNALFLINTLKPQEKKHPHALQIFGNLYQYLSPDRALEYFSEAYRADPLYLPAITSLMKEAGMP